MTTKAALRTRTAARPAGRPPSPDGLRHARLLALLAAAATVAAGASLGAQVLGGHHPSSRVHHLEPSETHR